MNKKEKTLLQNFPKHNDNLKQQLKITYNSMSSQSPIAFNCFCLIL